MPVKVVQINHLGNITFHRNSRSRNIRLSVSPGPRIRVSFPPSVSFREAARFVEEHADWIIRQRQNFETIIPKFPEDTEIQTRFHQVFIRKGGEKTTLKQTGYRVEIWYPEGLTIVHPAVQEQIRKIMVEIYRWEARKYLPGRVKELAAQHHFHYSQVTIRNNRSNWGSCSGQNNISLNLKLMALPDHLIDYIILHELAHTRVKNHGPQFYALLDLLTGNQTRRLKAEIRKYSARNW